MNSTQLNAPLRAPPIGRSAPVVSGWSLPPSSFEISRGNKPDSVRARGRDYLGIVKTGSSVGVATLLRLDFLSPQSSTFTGTRLQTFASMYEKYIFRKARIVYIPQVSTAAAGTIGMAFDKDFADTTPGETEDGLRQYLGFQNACTFPAWSPGEIDIKLTDMQDFFYCNDTGYDGRLVYQGQLYLFAVGSLLTTTNYGQLYIEYEIDFFDPQIENPLDYGTLQNSSSVVTSVSASAWNSLNATGTSIGKIITDQSGNKGVELSPGTWMFEQLVGSSTVSNAFNQPAWQSASGLGAAVITNILATTAATSGSSRVDKVTITGGPVRFFGSVVTASTLTNILVRWLRSSPASSA